MQRRTMHTWQALLLLAALLTTLFPHPAAAQDGGFSLFLPNVSGTPAAPDATEAELLEEELLIEAAGAFPEPRLLERDEAGKPDPAFTDPAATDPDGDGVPSPEDNCPFIPNRPINGRQPPVCGPELNQFIDGLVFLKNRTFRPVTGLDPGLRKTQALPRIHVLLHVTPNDSGVVLHPELRARLEAAGVTLLGYVPHNSFYASVPRDPALLQQLAQQEFVQGISSLRPRDKVAPQVRLRGPLNGRNTDGTLSFAVDFFADVPRGRIEQALADRVVALEHQYDQSYHVTLQSWQDLRRLAIQDMVYWIDDLPDPPVNDTTNGMDVTGATVVSTTLGYRGAGLVLSMTESGQAGPATHPDMNGRIIEGNSPLFGGLADGEHAQAVASIMIADESSIAANRGVLPEATMVTYSNMGLTLKRQHFGIPEEARLDHGALLNNNSWSSYNCAKVGEYTKRARFYDKAVYEAGISILKSSGNGRNGGSFVTDTIFQDCTMDLFSLPHASATKNGVVVGNMAVSTAAPFSMGALSDSSSSGPTADGRLKPDVVAPGNGLFAIDFNESTGQSDAITFSGTSASTPFTSGVLGLLAEAFENQSINANSVAPARYKAILIHTAADQGEPGPDFHHGYGLIQVDDAVRMAQEWSSWGREGTLDNSTTQLIFPFTVDSAISFYKATLVWDDEEGEHTSSMALKNDLDLTLVSPSGQTYRPFDVVLPFGATVDDGSIPCTVAACQDRLNNVEQVLVEPSTGAFVEQGNWEARVTVHRLVSNEQPFSLVLTPPCPLVLEQDVTLTADFSCDYTPLAPEAVIIPADDVELNCDGHKILGSAATAGDFSGAYKGIYVTGDNVTIRNCTVRRFDMGIALGGGDGGNGPSGARVLDNSLDRLGSRSINAVGSNHTIQRNSIGQMISMTGVGVRVRGDNIDVLDNVFYDALANSDLGQAAAVSVVKGSSGGRVDDNTFSGLWWQGIRLVSTDPLEPVQNYSVVGNEFEGILETPIRLAGNVQESTVSGNYVSAYGADNPGILVTADEEQRPLRNTVSGNTVIGFEYDAQTGIKLVGADETIVRSNPFIVGVGTGIAERETTGSSISGNTITNDVGTPQFLTKVAILSQDAGGDGVAASSISNNYITLSETGIEITGVGGVQANTNRMRVNGAGVLVTDATDPAVVQGNSVVTNQNGVLVSAGDGSTVSGNNVVAPNPGSGIGIVVLFSSEVGVTGNEVADKEYGISLTGGISNTVSANVVDAAATAAIYLNNDTDALLERNEITGNGALGIHYAGGVDAVLRENKVTSVGAGVGIRLGNDPAAVCAVDVDNILLENNVLVGGAAGLQTWCDVGTVTLVP